MLDVSIATRTGSEPLHDNEISTDPLPQDGLDRLHDVVASEVAAGHLPGAVSLVARGDDVHVDAVGTPSFTDDTPLARNAIFRIASLTKPIVAVAVLALVEEGVLNLEEPIDELVPELASRRVLRSLDAELDDTVPARRPILLEDLLSYRLGFGSVMMPPGSYPIQRAEAELGLQSIGGPPWPPVAYDADGWIAALGTLPLMYQPGERWLYNTSGQVLGILLARACGQSLESVLRTRIFDPLGMVDTGFTVPPEKLDRLPTLYVPDPDTGALSVFDEAPQSWWSTPPTFADGSGWLVSTIDDYWSFVSMMLAGGHRKRAAHRVDPVSGAHDVGPAHALPAGGQRTVSRAPRQLGLRTGGARRRLERTNRSPAVSVGTVAPVPRGAPTPAGTSPLCCSPSATRPRPCRLP